MTEYQITASDKGSEATLMVKSNEESVDFPTEASLLFSLLTQHVPCGSVDILIEKLVRRWADDGDFGPIARGLGYKSQSELLKACELLEEHKNKEAIS